MAQKILVVDDERHIVRFVQVWLERAGYDVVTALNGKDALEKVKQENPALVVLDRMMPDMDGIEVLKNLRRNPTTRELPVIMLAEERRADIDPFGGWQSGFECYLTKPVNPMELITFVNRIYTGLGYKVEGLRY